ncbi:MAG: lysophospholipid acyltransferase family protein [Paludibacteraceae bacterium]|nr:1-acyl-sn-glycerol-3-phosphate acyltransferase [Bacteroidales bacterium]MDD5990913.1 lysophospholipid acyltransferase family protein [Paludibacteraceae bacterium]MDD6747774.1 lysophospholipid acyltransferase family protein [Paludibacteraceae bacterium]MDY5651436.1 lysophospholipid acyltransferase family protein [Paludibacteraceae bacterium]
MKYVLRPFYWLWQYLIAWPLLVVLTVFTAVFTVCTVFWKNAEFVHKVQQFWSRSFFWLMFLPVSVDGQEHIVPGQSYVFVANHQSMFDVWLVYGWLPVIFKWLMKAELRKVPFVGTGCKAAGHIFIDRRSTKAAMESLKEVEKQLVNGVCTVIFPEGTRSLNGEVGRFKRGAFQIAWDLGLPIIPLSLDGCYEVLPKGKPFVYRAPVHMHIGEPIDLKQFSDPNEAIEAVRNAVIAGRISK